MAQHGSNAGDIARERILSVVKTSPGIHIRRISLLTGLSWNTCLHHLRVLDLGNQVTSRKVQGKRCWFDTRSGAVNAKRGICLMRDSINLSIANEVLGQPGNSQINIATNLDLAASVVHRRLVAMEQAGLVTRQPENRKMSVHPTQALEAVAAKAFQPEMAPLHVTNHINTVIPDQGIPLVS